ncbi:MAG: UDP-3-O-(3-hydroxymyristoyl)glucosamine N-acyltransferase [Candidatus Helarchaeota archaeon]
MGVLKKIDGKQLNPNLVKKIEAAVNSASKDSLTDISIEEYFHYENTCSIIHPKNNSITYARALKFLKKSNYTEQNCIIFIPLEFEKDPEFQEIRDKFWNALLIPVPNPLNDFLDIHDYFYSHLLPRQWLNNPKTLGNGVIIGENVEIGKDTVIYPNTVIYDNVKIGKNCIIHANCSIGGDGFRFVRMNDGTLRKMIHISNPGVIIEDDVEIQCNCNVSRAVFDPTRIGKGTKIDALVHIAHNDVIGENNMIAAQTCFSGSVEIGKNNWIGAGSTISNGVSIGDNNWIGLAAKVAYNIGNNERVSGFYAVSHKKWKSWWKKEFKAQ